MIGRIAISSLSSGIEREGFTMNETNDGDKVELSVEMEH